MEEELARAREEVAAKARMEEEMVQKVQQMQASMETREEQHLADKVGVVL